MGVSDQKPLAILHVPKTGGTSLNMWLERHVTLAAYRGPHEQLYPAGLRRALDRPRAEQPDVFFGHNIPYVRDADVRYVIVLRDPADWLVSCYHNDAMRRPRPMPAFDWWYEHTGPNTVLPMAEKNHRLNCYLTRWFGAIPMEDKKPILERFWLVTVTDRLDEHAPLIADYFGIENDMHRVRVSGTTDEYWKQPIPKTYTLTDAMRQRIYEENHRDYELYLWARDWVDRQKGVSHDV